MRRQPVTRDGALLLHPVRGCADGNVTGAIVHAPIVARNRRRPETQGFIRPSGPTLSGFPLTGYAETAIALNSVAIVKSDRGE
jgi:hypothetical protein